jgi:hypothetical protein
MAQTSDFDLAAAHKFFSAECFNRAWDLINKTGRTAEEDEEMLRLSLASTWHWTQRPDCTAVNMSIAYWQTSRIYVLLKQSDNARRYASLCMQASQGEDVPPFYLGYACEAAARALALAGDQQQALEYIAQANQAAALVTEEDDRKALLADLETIF